MANTEVATALAHAEKLELLSQGGTWGLDRFCKDIRALVDERSRLLACIEMIAQVRHVSGSAQSNHRSTLRLVDAVLNGADVRKLEVVEAIVEGTWKKEESK